MLTREDVFDIIESVLYENLPDVPEEEIGFVAQKVMDKLEDKGALDAMDMESDDDLDYDSDEEDYSDSDEDEP